MSALETARGCLVDMVNDCSWDVETRFVVVRKVQVPIPRGLVVAGACNAARDDRGKGAHLVERMQPIKLARLECTTKATRRQRSLAEPAILEMY